MNTIQLIGRLTKDVDLKFTQSGIAVGTFTLAVNRPYTNQQGERETDFIQCVIWRKPAENLTNFTRKGSLIGIEGRLQTRYYENDQKKRVYITEVVVDRFDLLESQKTVQSRAVSEAQTNTIAPSSSTSNGVSDFNTIGHPIDISEDDLPF